MPRHQRRPQGTPPLTWQPTVTSVTGRFVAASNATLLGETDDGTVVVYKPVAGERPLWDFPTGTLAWREVLAWKVADAMGLSFVPETVFADGPFGPGAVQRYVDVDDGFDPLPLIRSAADDLWPMAAFDVLVNNADRKVGHILSDGEGVVGVDHGLTFHPEDKLRTVLWAFAGRSAPGDVIEAVRALDDALEGTLGEEIQDRLGIVSRDALVARVAAFLATPVHPEPPDDRHPLPWPPY